MKIRSLTRDSSHESKPHQHPEGQLFIINKGLLILQTDDKRWIMPSQRAGWIPPGYKHSAKSYGAMNGVSFYLSRNICKNLPKHVCVFTPNPLLTEVLARCGTWQESELSPAKKRLIQVMTDELSTLESEPLYLPMPQNTKLEKLALAFIARPESTSSIDTWAQHANMATRTFTRHFRQETGMSFAKWCQLARVMKAMEYLAKGKSVTWVSLSLGYQSVSAFIKVFRTLMGATPAHYFTSLRQK
ncbi:MAG: helix-turn-helix transcriptional regulator [Gammaproteobacteria bacterium]|nr:helix-turn-helix transcriptional regulator [Gammaproteobacteria bacterium]